MSGDLLMHALPLVMLCEVWIAVYPIGTASVYKSCQMMYLYVVLFSFVSIIHIVISVHTHVHRWITAWLK